MMRRFPFLWITFLLFGCGEEREDAEERATVSSASFKLVDLDDPQAREDVFHEAENFDDMKTRSKNGMDLIYPPKGKDPYTGWVRETYSDGEIKNLIHYENGLQHGRSVWWQGNGRKSAQRFFLAGKPQGTWTIWDENGSKSEERHFKRGQADGPWMIWDRNGSKTEERHFIAGKPAGVWIAWRSHGEKAQQQSFKDGQPDGPSTAWYANGQKSEERLYEMGQAEGGWNAWYENGQPAIEGLFANGKLVSAKVWQPDGEKCPVSEVVDGNGLLIRYKEDGTESFRVSYEGGAPLDN
ncbi:MAG: toxin-antitoxin system YwqK family antitoxin [Opitutales bacterium]